MKLAVAQMAWSGAAAVLLAPAMSHEPGATVETLERVVGEGGELYGVFAAGAGLVAAYVLRVEQKDAGREGVIVAAGGRLPGYSLIRSILPTIEGQLLDCSWIRAHTARRGVVRELRLAGYSQREIVMAKGINYGRLKQ